ncbi:MAG: sigma-70 family RNA polymerase sigma factor [Candidatus Amulumruptor caecigallinarius]|nr:sigma-70 family RNA polymerase sigma factor [Candidatus Amulumruptor caecigallinarius]MCM1396075.1 sigma-70 family RNA polymerase sigma factor [Candidatus Amulumruptor caecigallinarius]MCM1453916.1 sigma-70 family RNA polymerase sigma factor [bacterium]
MNRLEELALVARVLAVDDRRAFARLVDAHQQALLRFLTAMCGDEVEAADIAQETFIKAWRGLRGWQQSGRFATWLYAIAINECRSAMRSRREYSSELPDEAADSTEAPADARMDLATAVESLSEPQREVVLLFYYRDMALKNIVKVTGMPENTVKSHLMRARTRLRAILDEK